MPSLESSEPNDHQSLVVPHSYGQNHFLVDFPGYVRDQKKALRTFGGLEGLSRQRRHHEHRIDLLFRPDDPYCHPVHSDDSRTVSMLVVKLKRSASGIAMSRREEDGEGQEAAADGSGKGESSVSAEVVASVEHAYSFSSPADMQYVGRDTRPWENQLVGSEERQDDNPPGIPETPLLGSSPKNLVEGPIDYGFRQYKALEHGFMTLGSKLKRRKNVWLDFFASTIPDVSSLAEEGRRGDDMEGLKSQGSMHDLTPKAAIRIVQDLFETRPAYLETAILELVTKSFEGPTIGGHQEAFAPMRTAEADERSRLGQRVELNAPADEGSMKNEMYRKLVFDALSEVCYRFKNGPWKGAWVRRGYDPRKDPAAMKLQVLEYSLPSDWYKRLSRIRSELKAKNKMDDKAHLMSIFAGIHENQRSDDVTLNSNRHRSLDARTEAGPTLGSGNFVPPTSNSYFSLCSFAGVPRSTSYFLQLCDIRDAFVEHILADPSSLSETLSDASGWLKPTAWRDIKHHVASRFDALLTKQPSVPLDNGVDSSQAREGSSGQSKEAGSRQHNNLHRVAMAEHKEVSTLPPYFLPKNVICKIEAMVLGTTSTSAANASMVGDGNLRASVRSERGNAQMAESQDGRSLNLDGKMDIDSKEMDVKDISMAIEEEEEEEGAEDAEEEENDDEEEDDEDEEEEE